MFNVKQKFGALGNQVYLREYIQISATFFFPLLFCTLTSWNEAQSQEQKG